MNKFDLAHMQVAECYAGLSSAERLKVGAVVVKDNRVISIGYNGTPAGWSNVCEDTEFIDSDFAEDFDTMVSKGYHFGAYSDTAGWTRRITKPEVIHAEANAVAKLARCTESGEGATMYVTHAPCAQCAKLIYTAGIRKVFYREQYRDDSGVAFLHKCNIDVEMI